MNAAPSVRVFGVELSVEETVTERNPPRRKAWETSREAVFPAEGGRRS